MGSGRDEGPVVLGPPIPVEVATLAGVDVRTVTTTLLEVKTAEDADEDWEFEFEKRVSKKEESPGGACRDCKVVVSAEDDEVEEEEEEDAGAVLLVTIWRFT